MSQPTSESARATHTTERPRGKELLEALERGELRVAERAEDGSWVVHAWIKEAILEIFRTSAVVAKEFALAGRGELAHAPSATSLFRDKEPFSVRRFGEHGSAYEVEAVGRNGELDIVVIESGERLTYALAEYLSDPVAVTVP